MNTDTMYADLIMDYYRNPRNYGTMACPDACARDVNVFCGDEITIEMHIKEGTITDIRFHGKGCAISQAATSMLTEHVLGKKISEAASMAKEEILLMMGIDISPMRLKCALLGLKVFKVAAYGYLGKEIADDHQRESN